MERDDPRSRIELELLLSDAFTRYVRDMSGMRVSARSIYLDDEDWKQRIEGLQAINYLNTAQNNMHDFLSDIEPQGKTYKKLRKELINLVNAGPSEKEVLLPIEVSGILKPGWGHKVIPQIREFFGLRQPQYAPGKYDDELAAAVMRFQRENGLKDDAVIGPNTLAVINRTTADKIKHIVVNMERLRWVDTQERGDKYVIVNIPSAKLWAIKDGRVDLEMPVIVGHPGRATQSFKTEITGLRLNPDWTVPPTIKRFDILPKIQEDPEYLLKKGMELFEGYGRNAVSLDPYSIDWVNITNRELHAIRMVQGPGDNNPLGRYRVLMPNGYNIYLHDTNQPELFAESARALSSGCVRMKYPEKMAEYLLEDIEGWSVKQAQEILDSYKKTDIRIPDAIPVYLFYYTTWLDDNGQIVYGNDIYGHDKKLIEEIQKIDGFYIPVHNDNREHYSNARLVSYQQ
ncbi:MAG: murein L,D-transpeptidase, partial [Alphaproteobacteria bacterium]